MTDWFNEWYSDEYKKHKLENFTLLKKYLKDPPRTILDIGCGLAWESRMFNQEYGSELWLLDGDVDDNKNKLEKASEEGYNFDVNSFKYYYSLEKINQELINLGTKNYHLIDCNNIDIPKDLKFDLITSWVSCGFHYPSSTYRNLILNHSHENTKIVFDLRILTKHKNPLEEPGVKIIKSINRRKKYVTAEIKFI